MRIINPIELDRGSPVAVSCFCDNSVELENDERRGQTAMSGVGSRTTLLILPSGRLPRLHTVCVILFRPRRTPRCELKTHATAQVMELIRLCRLKLSHHESVDVCREYVLRRFSSPL